MSIFSICLINSISIEIQWIPWEGNTQADYLSKIIDYEDWSDAAAATLLTSEYMIIEDLS
jgi:hypothetical protein